MRTKIDSLQAEIKILSETDKVKYHKAISFYENGKYENAINELMILKEKYPESKYIKLANSKIKELKQILDTAAKDAREKQTGIRVSDIKSEWSWILVDNSIYAPRLFFKIKNVSDKPIERLSIKAVFIEESKKEIFDEALDYTISLSDTPLSPGYLKRIYLYSNVGFTSSYVRLPRLIAKLYFNDVYYDTYEINRIRN